MEGISKPREESHRGTLGESRVSARKEIDSLFPKSMYACPARSRIKALERVARWYNQEVRERADCPYKLLLVGRCRG